MRHLMLGVFILWATIDGWTQDFDLDKFNACIESAKIANNRDEKVQYYKLALEERKNHPDNISLEYKIAKLLQCNTTGNVPIQPLEALKHYEDILRKYNYDDYYDTNQTEKSRWGHSKQNLFLQSAIQAGCIHNFHLHNQGKCREYEYMAIEMLEKTYKRRLADWINESEPAAPKEGPFLFEGLMQHERNIQAYERQVSNWKARQSMAKKGEVLDNSEIENAKIAVKHYGLSYGPQSPEMVPLAMGKIIKDFPGTPMAQIAQEHIDRSSQMVAKGQSEELGIEDIGLQQIEAPVEMKKIAPTEPVSVKSVEADQPESPVSPQAAEPDSEKSNTAWMIAIFALLAIFFIAVLFRVRYRKR